MPHRQPDPVVMAEARRLAAEDLDRDLDQVAELLAEQGHYGPDGRPFPARTVANLLEEELRRRRDERWRGRNREAFDAFNRWFREYGQQFAIRDDGVTLESAADPRVSGGGVPAGVNAVPTSYCVPADEYPLTPDECWLVMRGYMVLPACSLTVDDLERMPGSIEMLEGYLSLRH
jgi:hypothetical protein